MADGIPLVKDYMRSPVVTISAEAGLDRALMMMRTQRIRHLPVVDDDGQMVGLISDRDLRLSMLEMEQGPSGAPKGYFLPALTKINTVMISNVVTASPEMPLANAVTVMSERKFGCLPVLDAGSKKPVGIITETDMLRLLSSILKKKPAVFEGEK
ncbi:MAG TPA: CBS domain-containing protein [Planctomycetota bacterium]|nr:CBS domain-containing protein [Planctomycetota bacterium]